MKYLIVYFERLDKRVPQISEFENRRSRMKILFFLILVIVLNTMNQIILLRVYSNYLKNVLEEHDRIVEEKLLILKDYVDKVKS